MPQITKFHATRYSPDLDLDLVSAPPYDVISPSDRDRLEASHPNNFVHVSLGAQYPGDDESNNRYTRGAQAWRGWLDSGALITDPQEHLYLYRSDFEAAGQARATAGIVAALQIETLGTGGVYGHEKTTAGPKADRLALMRTTQANLEPLWFFSSGKLEGFTGVVEDLVASPPLADVTGADRVRHRLWQIPDDRADRLIEQVGSIPLVVADGHHRYETSLTYRDERRASDGAGPWDKTLVLISDPAQYSPELLPIHRLVKGVSVEQLDKEDFAGSLQDLESHVRTAGAGTIGVSNGSSSWTVRSTGEIDTVWLAQNVLEPAQATVAYEHDIDEVAAGLTGGTVAFVMASTPVHLVADKALQGIRMPPKTTLFWPKPRSGLIMRDLQTP